MFKKITLISLCLVTSSNILANDPGSWELRPYFGLSQMSDINASTLSVGSQNGTADIQLDSGFTAGFGVAYNYSEKIAAEIAWEYRSNDSQTTLADGQNFDEGNYASNIFFINGIYSLQQNGKWTPYLGAGLTWIQEVDIDLESNGTEISYSGDGDVGLQVFAGAKYAINPQWSIHGELRYGSNSGIELEGEEGAVGSFTDLDYQPLTVQVGLNYKF